jgi:hypothetical protein
MPSDKPKRKQRLWSSRRDRIQNVFSTGSGPGDTVRRMEEDVGLDSSSQYADADLPMDSAERREAIEAQKRHRADEE